MKKLLLFILLFPILCYSQQTGIRNRWNFNGIITFYVPHCSMYFDASTYAIPCTQNIPANITNAGGNAFTVNDDPTIRNANVLIYKLY